MFKQFSTSVDLSEKLEIVIISGLSGSGKTHALHAFEDCGFFCIDNLPAVMLPEFIKLSLKRHSNIKKTAVCIDIREREFLEDFPRIFEDIKNNIPSVEFVYLDSDNEVLMRRFSETRRPHPLAPKGKVLDGIMLERERLGALRNFANIKINTSTLNVHQLKRIVFERFSKKLKENFSLLNIHLISFGYKHGSPDNLDLMFDVRFLPNPYFVEELKRLTGNDSEICEYVFEKKRAQLFLKVLFDFFKITIPQYEEEGRTYLSIGIGCTGGKHRSVATVNKLAEYFRKNKFQVTETHRDIKK